MTHKNRGKVENRKRIPGCVYSVMSISQLKKLLKEHKLPTDGDRKTLEKRHRNFVLLYNSNLDSLNPKSDDEIRKSVIESEKKKFNHSKLFIKKKKQSNEDVFNKLIEDIKSREKKQILNESKTTVEIIPAEKTLVEEKFSKSTIDQKVEDTNKTSL